MKAKKQVVLIILDGWGYREDIKDNAVKQAKTPNFERLWNTYPHTLIEASGLAVGLPEGQMGNSEIGHTTIGAGKAIDTDLVRIKKAINNNDFQKNAAFLSLFEHVQKNNSTLHVVGLLGDGGVHAHSEHLYAFLRTAKSHNISKVAIHIFTDGRDTAPQSAAKYIRDLEEKLLEIGVGFIATISGRFFAMDRDNNWDRLQKVEKALFDSEGTAVHLKKTKASDYIETLYKKNKLDEHLEPLVCFDHNGESSNVKNNDAVFFFNFRADRARMLSRKFIEKTETCNICFATMTSYGSEFKTLIAFPAINIETTLAAEVSKAGFTQAHIAETEKFPHATYFLNGGKEDPHSGEEHVLLASRKDVATHDLAPKMRAEAIADEAIKRIEQGIDFIFINFANPDMVGHTANVKALIEAVEEVDLQLGRVVEVLEKRQGVAFVTADHGNAEVNVDAHTGAKHTSHTTNPVPVIVTNETFELRNAGTIADVAPTILGIMGLVVPKSMTGISLII